MRRQVFLAVSAVAVGSMALAASGDGRTSATAREAWGRILSVGGELRALGDPVAFSGVFVTNTANTPVVAVLPDPTSGTGFLAWYNSLGVAAGLAGIRGIAGIDTDGSGVVAVANAAGTAGFTLSGGRGLVTGLSNGDVAEVFPADGATLAPGAVTVIDPDNPGGLRLASAPYDRRVAGVVAGAGGLRPGVTLRGQDGIENPATVTLTGTVYCLASSVNGPIRAGDLLTTSSVPGHAMKATDPEASRGAILGKAMETLKGDKGTILVLASLQ